MKNDIQMLPLSKLETNNGQTEGLPKNLRQISGEKLEKLKKNIQQYPEMLEYRGLMVMPLDNGRYVIIGGNLRYHGLCIEMKTATGRLSDSQKEWQEAVTAAGYAYVVVRSLEGFRALIEDY